MEQDTGGTGRVVTEKSVGEAILQAVEWVKRWVFQNFWNKRDATFASNGVPNRFQLVQLDKDGRISHDKYGRNITLLDPDGPTLDHSIEVGGGRTGSGYAYVDLIGDTTNTDYGFRLIRGNSGANAVSMLRHSGTGNLIIQADDAANIVLTTSSVTRAVVNSSGMSVIGTHTVSDGSWGTGYQFSNGVWGVLSDDNYLVIEQGGVTMAGFRTDAVDSSINLGYNNANGRAAQYNFYTDAASTPATAVKAWVKRNAGVNGVLDINQVGTGNFTVTTNGTIAITANSTQDVTIAGDLDVGGMLTTGATLALYRPGGAISLTDDSSVALTSTATNGLLYIMNGSSGHNVLGLVLNGVFTEISDPGGTWVATDTDGNNCLIQSGTQLLLKNRRGATQAYHVHLFGLTVTAL